MGKESSPPPAPDYRGAAEQTAQGNLEYARYATQANRPNEYTPLGSRTWTNAGGRTFDQAGYDSALKAYSSGLGSGQDQGLQLQGTDASGTPYYIGGMAGENRAQGPAPDRESFYREGPDQWSSSINLTPEGQNLFDQQMRISQGLGNLAEGGIGRVGDTMGQEFNPNLPDQVSRIDDYSNDRSRVEEALMQRMQPYLDMDRAAQEQMLANQGHVIGGKAYGTANEIMGRNVNDARLAAIAAAGGEQSRLQQSALARGGFQNTARQNALAEALMRRNLPLTELNALRTGAQPSMPQFQAWTPQSTTSGPNYLGAAQAQGSYDQGVYNAGMASDAAFTGGLMSLLGTGAKMFMPGMGVPLAV